MAVTYTPTTNFSAKDSLPSNDPSKVIKGSEFSVEFTAIQTAFSLAAPVASPTFTGTVTIPTADINGGNIDGTVIGAATPAAGSFTTGQFGTSLNVDGTVTADGLTVDGLIASDSTSNGVRVVKGSAAYYGQLSVDYVSNDVFTYVDSIAGASFNGAIKLRTANNGGSTLDRVLVSSSGVSFYEDTGTTPKFFWDASAESLGIGTASPVGRLDVSGGADGTIGSITLAQGNTTSKIAKIYGTSVNTNEKGIRLNTFHYGDVDAVTITSDGNVGIGTTSPDQKLDVTDGAITAGGLGTVLIGRYSSGFPSSGDGYFSLTTNNADGINGGISFNTLSSGTLGERARIDSSGNLLVGKTDTTGNVAGVSLRSTGLIVGTVSGGTVGYFNRTTSDGTILDFRKDNTAVGSIQSQTGNMSIGSSGTGILFNSGANCLNPFSQSLNSSVDATLDIGKSNFRFKDLYLSGGVYLGGTGAANLLDDYEEGTFTPSITFGGNAVGVTYSPSFNRGWYTIVGRVVTLKMALEVSNKGSSTGALEISVPFASTLTTASHAQKVQHNKINAISLAAYGTASTSTFGIYKSVASTSSGQAAITDADCGTSFSIVASITYMI